MLHISRKYCEHPILTKKKGMKKNNPITELAMARFKECINTAYVPVTNASIIAPMANMESQKASEASTKGKSPIRFASWNDSGMNRWIKAAEQDCTMATVFVITNALNAAFPVRTAEPSWSLKPPGMVIPAVKATVAMIVSTTKWYWDASFMLETNRPLRAFHSASLRLSSASPRLCSTSDRKSVV